MNNIGCKVIKLKCDYLCGV